MDFPRFCRHLALFAPDLFKRFRVDFPYFSRHLIISSNEMKKLICIGPDVRKNLKQKPSSKLSNVNMELSNYSEG